MQVWRALWKTPGFTSVAVISIAIGVGINTTLFSALDGAFFRPPAVGAGRSLVNLCTEDMEGNRRGFPWADFLELGSQCKAMEVAAVQIRGVVYSGEEGAETLIAEAVSGNYFSVVLGGQLAMGSPFRAPPGAACTEPAVVISHQLWKERFGGEPKVLGKVMQLQGRDFQVTGVAPEGFRGDNRVYRPHLWVPFEALVQAGDGIRTDRSYRTIALLGALEKGASRKQAQAEVDTVMSRLVDLYPAGNRPERARVLSPWQSAWQEGSRISSLVIPLAGLVLVVACANVAALLLARNEQGRRESATRLALGGTRWHLIRRKLGESLALSATGTLLGLLMAYWLVRLLPSLISTPLETELDFRLDHRVLATAVALMFCTAFLSGLPPAWRAAQVDLSPLLKGETSGGRRGGRGFSGRNILVVGQVAVSLVFLIALGLLTHGFFKVIYAAPGFEQRELVLVDFNSAKATDPEAFPRYLAELRTRLEGLPGVQRTTAALRVPCTSHGFLADRPFALSGHAAVKAARLPKIKVNSVETNFFATLGIHLLRGRAFNQFDTAEGARVVIVSDTMARQYWPGEEALGKIVYLDGMDTPPREVVGVAQDVKNLLIQESHEPLLYVPVRQEKAFRGSLVVETQGPAQRWIPVVRQEMKALSSTFGLRAVSTMKESMKEMAQRTSILLWMLGFLGILALFLTVVGLYGSVSWSVTCRTREFGIRMALGASQRLTLWSVLAQGLKLALAGALLGLPLSIGAAYGLNVSALQLSARYGVVATLAVLLVALIALAASYVPARRAMRLQPMDALRCE